MHYTAQVNAKCFFDTYVAERFVPGSLVVEIGSQDVNGSLRDHCPKDLRYVGVDFVNGKGVDVVLDNPYRLPFESASVDVVLSSSCFEHSEMFWVLFLEILRVLKPHGLFYLNAPSNGDFHRYPVDCWRFYPDSGRALVNWAEFNNYKPVLLESYTSNQAMDQWNDCVSVFLKDSVCLDRYKDRIISKRTDFTNGFTFGCKCLINESSVPEDRRRMVKT